MNYGPLDFVGNIGVVVLMITYLMLQLNKLSSDALAYSVLNAVGAGLIVISLLFDFNLSALLMEVFWVLISFVGIYRYFRLEGSQISNTRWLNHTHRLRPHSVSTCPPSGILTSATWLTWPKDPETWPDRVPQVEEIYLQMMAALTPHEIVNLLVDDEETEEAVRRRCSFPRRRKHSLPSHSNSRFVDSRLWSKLSAWSERRSRFQRLDLQRLGKQV